MNVSSKYISKFPETLFLLGLLIFQCYWLPSEVFNTESATGGDTGSHFWPVYVLHHFGLPNWTIRSWNPGNLGGEGHLVHYFPFPFLIMALAGYVIPLGTAFNLGTILPVVTLPFSIWFCLYCWKLPPLSRAFGAIFSLFALYNESFTMWGGNTLSTLSGQFAHMYALNALFVGLGILYGEINKRKFPLVSALTFSACALSHAYIYISLPALLLLFILLIDVGNFWRRVRYVAISSIGSFCISLWFLIPMVLNGPWTTPHSFNWAFTNFIEESFPAVFEFPTFLLAASFALLPIFQYSRQNLPSIKKGTFWLVVAILYVGFFFIFRWLKLVDARAIPQVQLFFCVSAGIFSSLLIYSLRHWLIRYPFVLAIAAFAFYSTTETIKNYPRWSKFNYSGWSASEKYDDFMHLVEALRGDLSDPRVIAEHNVAANSVGTERVFEMLPYFANRSTGESLYLQSTVLAPMMFHLQAEVSKDPSCPFSPTWPCKSFSLQAAEAQLRLMGAGNLILSSDALINEAAQQSYLNLSGQHGAWHLYSIVDPPAPYFFLNQPPKQVALKNWRIDFWNWFLDYSSSVDTFIFANPLAASLPTEEQWVGSADCKATVSADFSAIRLKTACPGKVHVLRYAFSPWFGVTGADTPLLMSPGYIALIPRQENVTLTYGDVPAWKVTRWISIFSLVLLTAAFIFAKKQSERCQTFLELTTHHCHNLLLRFFPTLINWHKVSTNKKPHQYLAALIFLIAYCVLSLHFESWAFWRWRELRLGGLLVQSYSQDWGFLRENVAVDGKPIVIAGVVYNQGLGTHATSRIQIKLDRGTKRFSGACGLEDQYNSAKLRCSVFIGKQEVAVLPDLNSENQISPFSLDVENKGDIELVIESLAATIDGAHAVWINLLAE